MSVDPIEDELLAAQQAYLAARPRRQRAVAAALAAGWSKRRIARLWERDTGTVRAIANTAARGTEEQ